MNCIRLELPTSWGTIRLIGGSRAGEGTLLMLPQFRLALDGGRPHRKLPAMANFFISHGHTDHLAALAYWASQRALSRLNSGRLLAPESLIPDLKNILECHARMEGEAAYDIEVLGLKAGTSIEIQAGIHLEFFEAFHRIPTLGCRIIWTRQQLRPEFREADKVEILKAREAGVDITNPVETPILAYAADTGVEIFEHSENLDAEVLLLECSFWGAEDHERARRYAHLHLDDILDNISRISAQHLVLLHASRRTRLHEIKALIDRRLRPATSAEVHQMVVEWD